MKQDIQLPEISMFTQNPRHCLGFLKRHFQEPILKRMIEKTRSAVATAVNLGLTMLYWQIGKRINAEILKGERAKYGEEIIATLSQELIKEYGQGFNYSALTRMVRFAEVFPDSEIVATLSQQLSWSPELPPLKVL